MFDEVLEWIKAVLGQDYQYSRGMWVDHQGVFDSFICSVQGSGGPAIDVDDRRPRFRVILLGPREGRQHVRQVQEDAERLLLATLELEAPCDAASIRAMGEVTGPGYTTENRPWCQVDLQIAF